jgi:hypothetical protein
MDRGNKADNKRVFDLLFEQRELFEADFGSKLVWERLDNRRACRIKAEMPGDIFDKARWPTMIDAMVNAMVRLELAYRARMDLVKAAL